jgi:glycosyltransferase involved in cell wall biosynthesis
MINRLLPMQCEEPMMSGDPVLVSGSLHHVVLCVHRYPPALGGAETYAQRLAGYLHAQRGCHVRVWTTTARTLEQMWHPLPSLYSPIREARGEAVIERFPPLRGFPGRRWVLKALSLLPHPLWRSLTVPCNPICPSMWHQAQRYAGPVDAVHALAFPYAFIAACAWRLARRRQVPFFLTPFLHFGDLNNPRDPIRRAYTAWHLRWLLRQADGVFVQTEAERQVVLSCGVAPQRVHLQGMGVDVRECTGGNREAGRQQWRVDERTPVIGHLANLSRAKGTIDLLQATERLQKRGIPCRLVLAGPAMPDFHRLLPQYSGSDIVYLGPLSPQQKKDFFAAIDLFALPSRTDSFGLVLLEAWANGRPNVAYRAGGPGELIRHEQDGLLARCGDVDDLTEQLARLLCNPSWRTMMGIRGQQRIAHAFQWQDKLDLVWQVMAEAAQRTQQRGSRTIIPLFPASFPASAASPQAGAGVCR